MKKYSKKIALILALTLVLGIAIPALAVDEDEDVALADTVITGKYKPTKIKVVLPGTQDAIVNPYGLPVDIMDGNTVVATVEDSQIVTTTPMAGYNYGPVDLDIGATVVGEGLGDFILAAEAPDQESGMKTGLVYFEVKQASGNLDYTAGNDTAPTYFKGLKVSSIVNALKAWEVDGLTGEEGADYQIPVGTREITKNNMATIEKGTNGAPSTTKSCFIARLVGDIVKAPRDPWAKTDGVKVTISWILEPTEPDPTT